MDICVQIKYTDFSSKCIISLFSGSNIIKEGHKMIKSVFERFINSKNIILKCITTNRDNVCIYGIKIIHDTIKE